MSALSELKVPGPLYESLNRHFWEAARTGELLIQRCGACGLHVFYPRPLCPHCWADALTWTAATGAARLKSFTEIWKPGHPGWIPVAPYLVGLVELDEGPTLLSHILAQDNTIRIGDHLIFAPTNIGGHILPCFRREEPSI